MNSPVPATKHSATSRTSSAARPSTGVPPRVRVEVAANDETAKSAFENFKDPLWMVAIAMGILFGVMALLTALG